MGRKSCIVTLVGLCAGLLLLAPSARLAAQDGDWSPPGPLPSFPPPWLVTRTPAPPGFPGEPPRWEQVVPRLDLILPGSEQRFRLRLLDGSEVTIVRTRSTTHANGVIWFGRIENEPGSTVILSVVGNSLAGSIRSPWHDTHLIDGTGDGSYRLRRISPRDFRPENHPITTAAQVPQKCSDCSDPKPYVDLLVVYTREATIAYDLTGAQVDLTPEMMEAKIQLFIAEANRSYFVSDVEVRLNLVGIERVSFSDSGTTELEADLTNVESDDEVAGWRDEYAADIVVLLVGTGGDGLSHWPPDGVSNLTCNYFASVVKRSSAEEQLTFTHEIGHLFGANHNCTDPDMTVAELPGFKHGHDVEEPTACNELPAAEPWSTVMSVRKNGLTNSNIFVSRIAYWSNPNKEYPPNAGCSDKLGTLQGPCQADNAAVLNHALPFVANYRCSSESCDNVWMKDTWSDTGEEPDPATSGQAMWKSPDIWVRRERDANFLHAHEHENPDRGIGSNWIYVKLRNGSDESQSGSLDIRYANAATNTEWETGWTPIGAPVPVTMQPHSSQIVEREWPSIPDGSTHFCLLARWLSEDDEMSEPEDVDIEANVRNNNNIAWKNLTVVNFFALAQEARVRFIVRHIPEDDSDELRQVRLRIVPERVADRRSLIRDGIVRVRFSTSLRDAWQLAGATGSGYRVVEDDFLLTERNGASFDLLLTGSQIGWAELAFEKKDSTPKRDYVLDCELWEEDVQLGGVSFEVRNALHPR